MWWQGGQCRRPRKVFTRHIWKFLNVFFDQTFVLVADEDPSRTEKEHFS